MLNSSKTCRFLLYQANDSQAISKYMEKMARKGWLLESIPSPMVMKFRRIEPENLNFSVTYFPEASVYDPTPTDDQETYFDYCSQTGWELAAAYGPMQIFYSRQSTPIPIETDEAHKLNSIRKAMQKSIVFPYALLLALMLFTLYRVVKQFPDSPLYSVSSNLLLSLVPVSIIFSATFAYILIDHWIWCLRSKRSVKQGGSCLSANTLPRLVITIFMHTVFLLWLLLIIIDRVLNPEAQSVVTTVIGSLIFYTFIMVAFTVIKKYGKSRSKIMLTYFSVAIVAVIAFTLIMSAGIFDRSYEDEYIDTKDEEYSYYHDKLPVTLDDLGYSITERDAFNFDAMTQSSPFASYSYYEQFPQGRGGSNLPCIIYTATTIKSDWLREFCWKKLIATTTLSFRGHTIATLTAEGKDPTPWGAQAAFYKENNGYLLLYDDRILTVNMDYSDNMTDQQIDTFVSTINKN